MTHSFNVKLNDEISSVLKTLKSEALRLGGTLEGTSESGSFGGNSFLGRITGEYSCISNKEIRITITNKPFIVPYSLIEGEIRKYLA